MSDNAFQALYNHRLSQSTRPFLARGGNTNRCVKCMLLPRLCLCHLNKLVPSNSAFLLLMYDDEILKPSNTGRLISHVIDNTFAYIWSRTEPNKDMIALLSNPKFQPVIIFPDEYAHQDQPLFSKPINLNGKQPLFILFDGSWAQAKKMFRKSPYLNKFPLLSFSPETISRYLVRKATKSNQLATAEVAARALDFMGESHSATTLDLVFEAFTENYLLGKEKQQLPINSAFYKLEKHLSSTSNTKEQTCS